MYVTKCKGDYCFPNEKIFREVENVVWKGKLRWGEERRIKWMTAMKDKGAKLDGGYPHAVWYVHRMYYKVWPRYQRMKMRHAPEVKYLDELGSVE